MVFQNFFCAVHAKNKTFYAKIDIKTLLCDILCTRILEDRRAQPMWENLMGMFCNIIANGLSSIANIATNSISVFGQYEHEMPECLKK